MTVRKGHAKEEIRAPERPMPTRLIDAIGPPTPAQLDGNACMSCGGDFLPGQASESTGYVIGTGALFIHITCRDEDVTA